MVKQDLGIHALAFLVQAAGLAYTDFFYKGSTPPWVFPFFLLLAALTLFRLKEYQSHFKSRSIFIPAFMAIFIYGFCLINEMGPSFWSLIIPRQFPVIMRILGYHLLLLLLHPSIFLWLQKEGKRVHAWLSHHGYYHGKVWVLLLLFAFFLWILRSQNISPDGYDWLRHSVWPLNWANYLREPLGTLLFRIATLTGIQVLHWPAYISIVVFIILCACISTWIMAHVFRMILGTEYRIWALFVLLSCAGYTQVFAGNIEVYALLHTGLAFFLFSAFRYIHNKTSAWEPGITFAFLFCIHLSAAWWFLVFVALPWLKKEFAQNIQDSSQKEWIYLLSGFFLFAGLFFFYVMLVRYEGRLDYLLNHFWSDQVMYCGNDAAMFHSWTTFLRAEHYLDMMNEYLYLMAAVLPLLGVLLFNLRRMKSLTSLHYWVLALAGFYFLYSVLWHPDRPFSMDWDIFSGLTVPMVLLVMYGIIHLDLPDQTKKYCLYQSAVFSAVLLFFQLLRNHTKISDWPLY